MTTRAALEEGQARARRRTGVKAETPILAELAARRAGLGGEIVEVSPGVWSAGGDGLVIHTRGRKSVREAREIVERRAGAAGQGGSYWAVPLSDETAAAAASWAAADLSEAMRAASTAPESAYEAAWTVKCMGTIARECPELLALYPLPVSGVDSVDKQLAGAALSRGDGDEARLIQVTVAVPPADDVAGKGEAAANMGREAAGQTAGDVSAPNTSEEETPGPAPGNDEAVTGQRQGKTTEPGNTAGKKRGQAARSGPSRQRLGRAEQLSLFDVAAMTADGSTDKAAAGIVDGIVDHTHVDGRPEPKEENYGTEGRAGVELARGQEGEVPADVREGPGEGREHDHEGDGQLPDRFGESQAEEDGGTVPAVPEEMRGGGQPGDVVPRPDVLQGVQDGASHGRGDGDAGDDGRLEAPKTPLERALANVAALEIVAAHKSADGEAADSGYSPAELARLSLYSGWGGQADIFAEDLSRRPAWKAAQDRLRAAVSDETYASMRRSTLTAFYTPPSVADAMADVLGVLGVGGHGRADIIEPGCGTGQVIAAVERAGIDARVTGVELDEGSAELAAALHPGQDIVCAPLENCYVAEGSYDAAIGNVPFSADLKVGGAALHDYFIGRSIDAVRPGGAVCLLTSRYTMDKADPTERVGMARRAELLFAFRLPCETFASAGTDVVSDLLVMRRREEDLSLEEASRLAWTGTGRVGGVPVNRWFVEHPECIVGNMAVEQGRFGDTVGVHIGPGNDAGELLRAGAHARAQEFADMLARAPRRTQAALCAPRPAETQVSRYTLSEDGTVWWSDGGEPEAVQCRVRGDLDRLRGMVALRDEQEALLASEGSPDAEQDDVERAIERLAESYRGFAREHGRLCDPRNQRAWNTRTDYSGAALSTIEETRSVGGKLEFVREGDVLSRRVVDPARSLPTGIDDPEAVLEVTLNARGRVDLEVAAHVAGLGGAEEARAFLGELVVEDPESGELVEAEAFFSGDLAAKLRAVRKAIALERGTTAEEAREEWLADLGVTAALDQLLDTDGARAAAAEMPSLGMLVDPDAETCGGLVRKQIDAELERAGRAATVADRRDEGRAALVMLSEVNLEAASVLGGIGWNLRHCARLNDDLLPAPRSETAAVLARTCANWRARGLGRDYVARVGGVEEGLVRLALSVEHASARQLVPLGVAVPPRARWNGYTSNLTREENRQLALAMAESDAAMEYAFAVLDHIERGETGPLPDAEAFMQRREAFIGGRLRAANAARDDARVERLEALAGRLEEAMPSRVALGDISFEIGSAWMPTDVVMRFVQERLRPATATGTAHSMSKLTVERDGSRGSWKVTRPGFTCGEDAEATYGSGDWNALKMLEAALNNSPIRREKDDPSGTGEKVPDAEATAEAVRKRARLQDDFVEWARSTPEVAERLERVYNDRVNTVRPRTYDGSALTLPGTSSSIELRGHQKDAVMRCLRAPEGTLVAHAVGAGKTFTGVAVAMEARRLGRAKKPLFAVPNALTEQWAADFIRLYPRAKVLYMTQQESRSAEAARRFWAKAKVGDWDAVIVAQSKFDALQLTPDVQKAMVEERISELQEDLAQARGSRSGGRVSFSVKAAEKERARLEDKLRSIEKSAAKLEGATFDGCGFDMLFVDEAHNYKNLSVTTTMDAAGVSTSRSAKCEMLYQKCMWLRSQGHGANIVFATGTPVSNTMSELYNLQRYVAPGMLEATGTRSFDAWASTFGKVEDVFEVLPEGGGFRTKQRFSKFRNLPELMAAFHEFADILPPEDLDLEVPELEVVNVQVEPSPRQKAMMDGLVRRAEIIRNGDPEKGMQKPLPTEDNMLCITNDGRKIALDPRLVDPTLPPEPAGKAQACAERVYRIWREGASESLTQLVFCDSSTPNGDKRWNAVDDLMERLAALAEADGLGDEMRSELRSIWDVKDNAPRRQELFDQMQEGRVRILVGSTPTLGTGVNVQRRLVATHDLDCPWRPSDLEQRQGRIERQGNMNKKATIFRYVTEGSFDAYLYQTVERKQRFVSQVFTSKTPLRDAEEADDVAIGYAELKALATGDEDIRHKLELEAEIEKLDAERRAHAQGLDRLRERITWQLEPVAKRKRERAEAVSADSAGMAALACEMERRGAETARKDRVEWSRGVVEAAQAARLFDGKETERIRELADGLALGVHVRSVEGVPTRQLVLIGQGVWPIGTALPSPEAPTAWEQVARAARRFQERHEKAEQDAAAAEAALASARAAMGRGWPQRGRYDECRDELARVDARLAARELAGAQAPSGGEAVEGKEQELYTAEDQVLDLVLAQDAAALAELVENGRTSWPDVDNIVTAYTHEKAETGDSSSADDAWNTVLAAKEQAGACAHALIASTPPATEGCSEELAEEFMPGGEAVGEHAAQRKADVGAI